MTLQEFNHLSDEKKLNYIQIFSLSKVANTKVNHLNLDSPIDWKLDFWTVKNIQNHKQELLIKTDWLGYISVWDPEKYKTLGELGILEAWQMASWIEFEINQVNQMENNSLSGRRDPIAEQAGIKDFEKFGVLNQIIDLAGGDPLKWEEVKKLPYMVGFMTLAHRAMQSRFERRYNEILRDSNNG